MIYKIFKERQPQSFYAVQLNSYNKDDVIKWVIQGGYYIAYPNNAGDGIVYASREAINQGFFNVVYDGEWIVMTDQREFFHMKDYDFYKQYEEY